MKDKKPRPVTTLWRRGGRAGNWTRFARASDCQVIPQHRSQRDGGTFARVDAPIVPTRIVVSANGFHLCVEHCPLCLAGHRHPGCFIRCCTLCIETGLAWLTQCPCECDPREAALKRGGVQTAPCGFGEYRLLLSRQPAVFAPHYENDPRAHSLMIYLARLCVATSTDVMEVRPSWKLSPS
jgi:hypothetical protein